MSEAWEFRPGDVDLNFCKSKNIPVSGVNEDFDGFNVFSSCGQLALKLYLKQALRYLDVTLEFSVMTHLAK